MSTLKLKGESNMEAVYTMFGLLIGYAIGFYFIVRTVLSLEAVITGGKDE